MCLWVIKHHFSFTAHQAHTRNRFARTNKCCPGVCKSHVHEPWGFKWSGRHKIFATSEEAAYPMELASEIAHAFKDVLQEQHWILEPPGWTHSSFAAMRAITGQQPKASKLPSLVTEHKQCIRIEGPSELMNILPCQTMVRCKQALPVPKGCYSSVDVIPSESQLLRPSQYRTNGGQLCTIQVWGIAWSEEDSSQKPWSEVTPDPLVHWCLLQWRKLFRVMYSCQVRN